MIVYKVPAQSFKSIPLWAWILKGPLKEDVGPHLGLGKDDTSGQGRDYPFFWSDGTLQQGTSFDE